MTTQDQIEEWFDLGVKQKFTHMLIVCDTFDYEDYPVFTATPDECKARYKNPGDMQKVMEVYDLSADKAAQLAETLALHIPT